uniref:non-specific serine/threonine protein kinase n=1 Tax=Ananas comosus var. bracteatus TaxID=296719 RepID=A0A6V7NYZ9_ANACO|nr:unnamed protein product [Ananas comosus var. bracteatus]
MSDAQDWNRGCRPTFNLSCEARQKSQQQQQQQQQQQFHFVELPQTDFYGFDFAHNTSISFEDCRRICARSCSCLGFGYRLTGEECSNASAEVAAGSASMYGKNRNSTKWAYLYVFALALGALELLFVPVPEVYVPRAERSDREIQGRVREGRAGAVYRGVLEDKRVVAVKKLTDVSQGEEEFWAEVSVIGRINHMNLVRLWGFCSEGRHRLLVYEFIDNESLDKYLFGSSSSSGSGRTLSWNQRFKIALGTARGLAYLHHECLEWIIHCDIKPENILLNRDFEPKIADFGLAKLSKRDGSGVNLSKMRGTTGYMAPEWTLNLPITGKVDVYSFGVVLLEVVTGSRISSWVGENGKRGN